MNSLHFFDFVDILKLTEMRDTAKLLAQEKKKNIETRDFSRSLLFFLFDVFAV